MLAYSIIVLLFLALWVVVATDYAMDGALFRRLDLNGRFILITYGTILLAFVLMPYATSVLTGSNAFSHMLQTMLR